MSSAGTIEVRRNATLVETLFEAGDTAWAITPMHGGKHLQYTTPSGVQTIRYQDGSASWEPSAAPTDPDAFPSGTTRGLSGLSHDGDSSVAVYPYTFNPGNIGVAEVVITAAASGESRILPQGFDIALPEPTLSFPAFFCAGKDGADRCLAGYGYHENVHYQFLQAYYSPRYDRVLVSINYVGQRVYPLEWFPCSVPAGDGTATQCRTINYDYQSDSTAVYSFDLSTGQRDRLGGTAGRSTFWIGISEADDELVLGSAVRIARFPQDPLGRAGSLRRLLADDCRIEYRSRTYSTVVEQVPSSNGCHVLDYATNDRPGGGTIAALRGALSEGKISYFLPSAEDVARAWGISHR